jgi:protein phosphatase
MEEIYREEEDACPCCGDNTNEADALFCQTCGSKLGSSLILAVSPPQPRQAGSVIAGRFKVESVLWSAPTYNAYAVADSEGALYMVLEQRLDDPLEDLSRIGAPGEITGEMFGRVSGSLGDAASAAFQKFGLLRPVEHAVEEAVTYIAFERPEGQAIAHHDQTTEKEAHAVWLQLCDLAEQFHRHGWVYNGFDPYSVLLDDRGRVSLIGFDRARRAGTRVEDAPIYPSRGFTAPELFEEQSVYDVRADVYSIGALLQFLLTGGSLTVGSEAGLYPVCTVTPVFERVLARSLAEDPEERFQSIPELKEALTALSLPIVLQAGHCTDVGLTRELNEDSVLALTLTQYYESVQTQIGLYIVSDGMGGEAAGEVASRVTVRAVAEWVTDRLISASLKSTHEERIIAPTLTGGLRLAVEDGHDMATTEMLRSAVVNANREVMAYARQHPEEQGLGATVTVAMIVGEVLTIAHVGDSRCYLLSGDRFEQLTEDHSLVQRMINDGNLSRSEARIHPYRNVIYRSIGTDEQIEIDIIRRRMASGDTIMLCSDGLNGMLSDDQIRDTLIVNPDTTNAAKELVVAANAAGGEDNTSVIVVRLA